MKDDRLKLAFFEALRFEPRIPLANWVEQHIVLSARACPTPGPFILWKYQRGILDAVDDPSHLACLGHQGRAARLHQDHHGRPRPFRGQCTLPGHAAGPD